ncbi:MULTISPECIES: ABC transporter permease subunit [Amycolatopsis]|uniref:ABC transporter permease subunit n=1 Tax=Amycolatopsis TaxID=1813 RepID=UPI0018E98E9C|nr:MULTISPECIES: ABC transporter permease subunit [Amycolatopsis]
MTTLAPYRSGHRGRDGFAQLLHAEWTKFRTVRGWVAGLAVTALVTVLIGLFSALGNHTACGDGKCDRAVPVGPGGQAVTDSFFFVHSALTGDGTLTARVSPLTGTRGVEPWAKAGLILKDGTTRGSAYAALMQTGAHGVRMQHNFTEDLAAPPGSWSRLTRTGDTITGSVSADGVTWTDAGAADLPGLPETIEAGLFATSPKHNVIADGRLGGTKITGGPTQVSASFDGIAREGGFSGGWRGDDLGADSMSYPSLGGGFTESGGAITVRGSGDIAPAVTGDGERVEESLVGAFAGLIAAVVVGTLFATSEYRRGLIRTTLIVSPRRERVLAAKALVLGAVTFAAALAGVLAVVPLSRAILRGNGNILIPVPTTTELRVVVGTAAVIAVAAVFALAVGSLLRRSAGAVALGIATLVLPYLLATSSVLPSGAAQWLLRVTPAAAFAVQQSIPEYPQVLAAYTPAQGYYPLPP